MTIAIKSIPTELRYEDSKKIINKGQAVCARARCGKILHLENYGVVWSHGCTIFLCYDHFKDWRRARTWRPEQDFWEHVYKWHPRPKGSPFKSMLDFCRSEWASDLLSSMESMGERDAEVSNHQSEQPDSHQVR